ncbi:cation:proton antiporter [Bradyrhizobium sp. 180]|uniref:cation:proton antiporter domain-containing protein n=1 Tax=Bradyrhizobium sp. 180 TaxID=2782650 RepID=UPI001FF8537D|nr:cation:proton antiporter [Bradyrhizobium sp. 180]MCK1489754.1 cation:proton antiporter [Bradyrhizobium sp. 180]
MIDWLSHLTPPTNVKGPVLIAYLMFDVFLIVVLARLLGGLVARIGQPRVVGEILAGILLGPTLVGKTLSQVIAPDQARPVLGCIATIALTMFMFLAGIEFDRTKVSGRGTQASVLAIASIAIPALLGFPIASAIHSSAYFGPAGADFFPFALFVGAALSVTAFPVMAHILMERGELNSPIGSLGIATTGLMSILMFGYIAFAGAVAAAKGYNDLLTKLVLVILFLLVAWFVVRPLLGKFYAGGEPGAITSDGMAVAFGGMMLFGLISHLLGINALVGGFIWGLVMPEDRSLRAALAGKFRDVAMVFLLPIFFAMAGFASDLRLMTLETLPAVGLILFGAIAGKFLAAVPARTFGLNWRDVGTLGALFNTRGLLVLVVGLIGLELQIINNLTFTIIVIVALVTNLMTLPLLSLFSAKSGLTGQATQAMDADASAR